MRQAGRYMKEYRALRRKHSFLEMCRTPELAAKVTLLPVEQFNVDAAIIFSDILIPLEPMGIALEFGGSEGPVFQHPIREMKQINKLRGIEPEKDVAFLLDAICMVCRELNGKVPLIGFEGGHSKNYTLTKGMMYQNRGAWDLLMEKLTEVLIPYLNAQVKAGVQALQVFDSWVGCLSPSDYEEYVLPYSTKIFDEVDRSVPIIHFGTMSSTLLERMKRAGGDVIGVDWRIDLGEAWARLGYDVAIQGNLDPVILLGSPELIEREVKRILERAAGRPGHIFNLGHGILPNTPVENVTRLVDAVHELSSK
jgi:uroporphyrinogen decarboxylase